MGIAPAQNIAGATIPIELHNFTWEGVRLVQVETQPHHIAGVPSNIRETLKSSDCEWEDIYSASYVLEKNAELYRCLA